MHKLVRGGRGGYCYEHNLLFMHVLKALGFTVIGLGARVLLGPARRRHRAPQPHAAQHRSRRKDLSRRCRLRRSDADGAARLRRRPGAGHSPRAVPRHRDRRRLPDAGLVAGEWRTLYSFDFSEHFQVDYEITNYFLSTHPSSHFTTTLVLARALPDRRLACRNDRLSIHHLGGGTEQRTLSTAGELADVVETLFGVGTMPDRMEFERVAASRQGDMRRR